MAAPAVPDQVHINQVRNALWRWPTGGASVMVGAGFSQNAESKVVNAPPLPSWEQITRKIQEELYQTDAEPSVAPSATVEFLQLAQEYDVTFGRTALCQLLKDTVREEFFEPGVLHNRLLSLPWRDVFTTNWDTLLERSRTHVTERSYGLVNTVADLASSRQPRIIKLHGSLPSHQLIFTDEDYRTYPNRFAPFVNTVKQGMMETVFLLIGFSGDDPNFRYWSGWVRDNMGAAAPRIYLAGWLNFSPHRRQVLENRNVFPIDLARHPQAQTWPERQRHRYATEWLLHTLESGRPYDVIDWPTPSYTEQKSTPVYLEPVENVLGDRPIAEPDAPSRHTSTSAEIVRDLLQTWEHNRNVYPGWITFPARVRDQISWRADSWEPHILRASETFDAIEGLNAIEALIWRREMSLDPMSEELERTAARAIRKVDCQARAADGVDCSDLQWPDVRGAWRAVALALVTAARQRFDRDQFFQRIDALSPFLDDDEDVRQRVSHERALLALYSIDFDALETELSDWNTDTSDPLWMLRKASILIETHQVNDGRHLFRAALNAIRSTPHDGRDLSMVSREAWALFMEAGIENDLSRLADPATLLKYHRRGRVLATMGADAFEEMHRCATALQNRSPTTRPDFDLGIRVNLTRRTKNPLDTKAALRTVRLTEVAALPPIANHMQVSFDILRAAADILAPSAPLLAMQLVLRTCTNDGDDVLNRVFSRARVATLSMDAVNAVAQSCSACIDYSLRRIGDQRFGPRVERLRVALEILSRIVLRFPPDKANMAFEHAFGYYSNPTFARNPWLSHPVRDLLNRCWEALPEDSRSNRVLDMMKAPLVGVDGFERANGGHPYVDMGETVSENPPPLLPRDDDTQDRWEEVCAKLIRGLRAGADARERASIRLGLTGLCDRLTDSEKSQISGALWHPNYTDSEGLPTGTLLYDHVFLRLPEPTSGMAAQRFRKKWLSDGILERVENHAKYPRRYSYGPITPDPNFLDDVIGQIGTALAETKRIGHGLVLYDDKRELIVRCVDRWCDIDIPEQTEYFFVEISKPIRYAVEGLCTILLETTLDNRIAAKLYLKLDRLHQANIPAFRLIAGLTKIFPNRRDDLVMRMMMGLVSEDRAFSTDAAAGLMFWLREATMSSPGIQPPPDELIHEIGKAIAARRRNVLNQALEIAEWIFSNGQPSQVEVIRDLTVQGLGYLLEELRYDRLADTDTDELDVPLTRLGCARVAVALDKQGAQEQAVAGWMAAIDDDPLPEVRHTKRSDS